LIEISRKNAKYLLHKKILTENSALEKKNLFPKKIKNFVDFSFVGEQNEN
jgi:hypothetical protein